MRASKIVLTMSVCYCLLKCGGHSESKNQHFGIYSNGDLVLELRENGEFEWSLNDGISEIFGNYKIEGNILSLQEKNFISKSFLLEEMDSQDFEGFEIIVVDEDDEPISEVHCELTYGSEVFSVFSNESGICKFSQSKTGFIELNRLGFETARIELETINSNRIQIKMLQPRFREKSQESTFEIMGDSLIGKFHREIFLVRR